MSADTTLAQWRDRVVAANANAMPLRLRGAGTKDFFGEGSVGEILDTRDFAGIVAYEPTELVVTARCGTPLSAIEQALAQHGQFLAFEPPAFGGDPTIGGIVAAGLSGPRRASTGAVRDFVLGATLLNTKGEVLRFGGQVMKNVAGFDVSRLLCGSLGILGLITEVSLKVLPRPRAEATLRFDATAAEALDRFNGWRAQPLPISATSWHDGIAHVRLSGAASAVRAACDAIGGSALDEAAACAWWLGLRDQTLPWFVDTSLPLWRLSLPATAPLDSSGAQVIEWSGALRWLRSAASPASVREAAERLGGSAMLWRGRSDAPMFHPLAPGILELHRRLKREFDPNGIFNRGRLVAEL
jgi:glycolate oxidase FAD binding subunit